MATITYVRVGLIERGPRYRWCTGYSENGNTYPWITRREAQTEAQKRGARAVFLDAPRMTALSNPHTQ